MQTMNPELLLLKQLSSIMNIESQQRKALFADHETRIMAAETELADHETRIAANESELADHDARITQNTTDIDALDTGSQRQREVFRRYKAQLVITQQEYLRLSMPPRARNQRLFTQEYL